MEQTPLCCGEACCGAHASVEHGRRQHGSQARDERQQQMVDHNPPAAKVKEIVVRR